MTVVKGSNVLTASGWAVCDVAIHNGTVSEIGAVTPQEGQRTIDGTGMFLGPGFVDLHTHLREPGQTHKEDIASGTRAAAEGGFTAVVAMPNTSPVTDRGSVVDYVRQRAKATGCVEVGVAGALTLGQQGEAMAHLDSMYEAGVRLFTDDGVSVARAGLLARTMQYLSDRDDVVVAQHAEDTSLAAGGHIHLGVNSDRLGIAGLASEAETVVIARDLILAEATDVAYHVQHLSTAQGVDLVRKAKAQGLRVTAEVTPHHLVLDESSVSSLDPNFKMYPPLRSDHDRHALQDALFDGTIDVVATDHAPHTESEKDVPFELAPRGVIGLETSFSAALEALHGDVGLVFERMSLAPARIAGFESQGRPVEVGRPANLVLVDPGEVWRVEAFASRSSNSPFLNKEMKGRVLATWSDGVLVGGKLHEV